MEVAARYSEYNGNIHVTPNAVDPTDWPDPKRITDGRIRIGWAGGYNHLQDAHLVETALRNASQREDVDVIILGFDPEWDFEYEVIPFTPSTQVYRDVLSILDIGLAPLIDTQHNRCKSDLKWLEYSMAGVMTIASNLQPYNMTIPTGCAMLANGAVDFDKQLKIALHNSYDDWQKMVRKSLDHIYAKRTIKQMVDPYRWMLASVGVDARGFQWLT